MIHERKTSSLDFFTGGVPAGTMLQMKLGELSALLENDSEENTTLAELAFLGAVSQFEAFWKDSFASLINIAPLLLNHLSSVGINVQVDPLAAIEIGDEFWHSIGFLVAERTEFGSGRKIDSAFSALLTITPFSKDERKRYDKILSDRNLLVHHGGVYTNSYLRQRLKDNQFPTRVHLDSLVVDKTYVIEKITFIEDIAQKFINSSKQAMDQLLKNGTLEIDAVGKDAIFMYTWWDDVKDQ